MATLVIRVGHLEFVQCMSIVIEFKTLDDQGPANIYFAFLPHLLERPAVDMLRLHFFHLSIIDNIFEPCTNLFVQK